MQKPELVRFLTDRTGRGVKLEGLGTYLPNIDPQGRFDASYRQESQVRMTLNEPGVFTGRNLNTNQYTSKSSEQLVALWNEEHPDDPIE